MQKQAERPQHSRFGKVFVLNEWSVNYGKYKREIFGEVGRGWIRWSFVRHIKVLYLYGNGESLEYCSWEVEQGCRIWLYCCALQNP